MDNENKKRADIGVPLKRLVMERYFVMLWRFPAYILATPWGLWLAVRGNVRIDIDWSEMWYDISRRWFGVLARPAFWLGYASDAEYRKTKHHNVRLTDEPANNQQAPKGGV